MLRLGLVLWLMAWWSVLPVVFLGWWAGWRGVAVFWVAVGLLFLTVRAGGGLRLPGVLLGFALLVGVIALEGVMGRARRRLVVVVPAGHGGIIPGVSTSV